MPGEPLSIFISYSRTDSEFVDRLEADLKARSFRPWVDRRKLEGGQDWMDELQNAIDRCQILLVVLSSEAMASKYVRREYRYADQQGKPIIPLNWRPTKVPLDLNGLQWVDFQRSYDQGLYDLQIALSRQELAALSPAKPRPSSGSITISEPEPVMVTPQPAPPPPNVDLNELYRAGVAAKANGDLERTAIFWQQVLDRDLAFGNGTLASQMQRLQAELHPIRVQHLREQAEQADRTREWGQAIGAWQALLAIEPQDKQAKERLAIVQQNQQYDWLYANAQEFARANNLAALKEQLELIWQNAPYYGDPAGLAKLAGLVASRRKQQRKEFVTSEDGLKTFLPLVWICAFCLLSGIGVSIGALSQLWPWAVGAVVAAALLSYALGYRRALGPLETSVIVVVSCVVVFGLTWLLATFQYDQPHESHPFPWLPWPIDSTTTLGHQVIFGFVLGILAGILEGLAVILTIVEDDIEEGLAATMWVLGAALVVWVVFAILSVIFNWGFGFGFGWAFTLLAGFLPPFVAGLGLSPSIFIWWKALTTSPEGIHRQKMEAKAI